MKNPIININTVCHALREFHLGRVALLVEEANDVIINDLDNFILFDENGHGIEYSIRGDERETRVYCRLYDETTKWSWPEEPDYVEPVIKPVVRMSNDVKKALARALTPTQRKWWKEGELFSFRIQRKGNLLKRWGGKDNIAKITCNGKGKVTRCNLTDRTWTWMPEKKMAEAVSALDYFVYGSPEEYEVTVM